VPGGAQIGIEYVAAPVFDTENDPLVRPTAAFALVAWLPQTTSARTATMDDFDMVVSS